MKDRIVEQASDRLLRIVREVYFWLRPHLETVPEAAGLIWQKSAAMRQAHFQRGMALEHAAEHEARARDRGLERQADQVFQVIRAEPLRRRAGMRVNEDEGAKLGRRGPERFERGIVEIPAAHVRSDHGATQAERPHRAAQLARRKVGRLQRYAGEAQEAGRVAFYLGRDLVVLERGAGEPERGLAVVEKGEHG